MCIEDWVAGRGRASSFKYLNRYECGFVYDASPSPLTYVPRYSHAHGWTYQSSEYFGRAHGALWELRLWLNN